MFSKKQFASVSNLRFISRTNFMLSCVEHEKGFITSGSGLKGLMVFCCITLLRKKFHLNYCNICDHHENCYSCAGQCFQVES